MYEPNSDIQVSVCIVTYNHESYIADCLESLVTQQTDFKFEIIVGEDCSTDNTRQIVQQFVKRYPKLIIPLFYEKNVGAVENIKRVYQQANGKYIAHLDGDDVALPNKLQQQFDILEQKTSCNICSHDMIRIDSNGKDINDNWTYPEGEYDLLGLFEKLPFFSHSSKMFRNKYDDTYWEQLFNSPTVMDTDVHIANMTDGNIWHIGEVLGQYRVGVGFSYQYKKNIPIMLNQLSKSYEIGIKFFENQGDKQAKVKYYYALFLIKYAYVVAVNTEDKQLFKDCIDKSRKIEQIGGIQVIFMGLSYCAYIAFPLIKSFSLIRKVIAGKP